MICWCEKHISHYYN